MKGLSIMLALLATFSWAASATAADYPALEGSEQYFGVVALSFTGDDVSGSSETDFLNGIRISGLLSNMSWQAFWAKGWSEDAMVVGGALDFYIAHNFENFTVDECNGCAPEGLWWFGGGPTVIAYRDMLLDAGGGAIDGEEFGLNLGAGYHWENIAMDAQVHYFPESQNTMLSIGIFHSF